MPTPPPWGPPHRGRSECIRSRVHLPCGRLRLRARRAGSETPPLDQALAVRRDQALQACFVSCGSTLRSIHSVDCTLQANVRWSLCSASRVSARHDDVRPSVSLLQREDPPTACVVSGLPERGLNGIYLVQRDTPCAAARLSARFIRFSLVAMHSASLRRPPCFWREAPHKVLRGGSRSTSD